MCSIQFHVKNYASFLMKQTIYLSIIDLLTQKNCVWISGSVDFAGINQEIQVF
jgi:hypothetical protein